MAAADGLDPAFQGYTLLIVYKLCLLQCQYRGTQKIGGKSVDHALLHWLSTADTPTGNED